MNRYIQTSRMFLALLFALVGIIGPLAPLATAQASSTPVKTVWDLNVGASSGDEAVQANFYIPRQVWIHVGDSVKWTWQSGEIHTVTFLNGNTPPPFPASFGPSGGSSIPAKDVVSSGIGNKPLGTTYTLAFTAPGNYTFNCLVHSTMWGVVHVRPAGQKLPHDPAWYIAQANSTALQLVNQGLALEAQGLQIALAAGPNQVNAGYGELEDTGSFAILRFQPNGSNQPLTIKAGGTVVFTNRDPETPHTVTFNGPTPPYPPDNPFASYPPAGQITGPGTGVMNSTGDFLNSGFLLAQPISPAFPGFGTTFKVTFTSPGTYNYHCELHDELGMTGTVVVTP